MHYGAATIDTNIIKDTDFLTPSQIMTSANQVLTVESSQSAMGRMGRPGGSGRHVPLNPALSLASVGHVRVLGSV